jgi:hypothetical protein
LDVRSFGAAADGKTIDTPAVNQVRLSMSPRDAVPALRLREIRNYEFQGAEGFRMRCLITSRTVGFRRRSSSTSKRAIERRRDKFRQLRPLKPDLSSPGPLTNVDL